MHDSLKFLVESSATYAVFSDLLARCFTISLMYIQFYTVVYTDIIRGGIYRNIYINDRRFSELLHMKKKSSDLIIRR